MGISEKVMQRAFALVFALCMAVFSGPSAALADEGGSDAAEVSVDSVIATNWGSYVGCVQWLGVNAEVSGAADADELTFFLTEAADGTEADLAATGLCCTCTVADLPANKAGTCNAGSQDVGFVVSGLSGGQYWLGCKLVSGDQTVYAAAPRSFTVYETLADFADAALERTLACSRHSGLVYLNDDGTRSVTLGAGGDYGDDWEAWMLPALVSGGTDPLFESFDATAYLNSIGSLLDQKFSSATNNDLSLKDYFRYVTALCAVGEDPRDFRGYNLVEAMTQKVSDLGVVANAKRIDPLTLSYFLLACKIACVTADEGFSVADETACYEGLLAYYAATVGTGRVSSYMLSDIYAMSMLPLCFPAYDTDLQARLDAAKQQMLDAYADQYQYVNGAIAYGQPAVDNGVFAKPNANSLAVLVNTFVLMGYGADDLAGARWQKQYGSAMSAWMSQMNDNGWMTYGGSDNDNDMATYQTLGALVDLHNSKSCFAIANERYLDAHPGYAATRFDDAIAALPDEPGLDDESAVAGARAAYERLTTEQRGLVTRRGVYLLEAAEKAIAKAKAAVADVAAKIAAIGEVTLESKDAIDMARAAYDALTDDQKALVGNYDVLVAAEAAYTQAVADAGRDGDSDKYRQLQGSVYLSISEDGAFAVSDGAEAGQVLAYVPVDLAEVCAVDLDDYGLGDYKRAAADADADYVYETTLLQLFVYASEHYSAEGAEGLSISGDAGSAYLKSFFGHDENLKYFVNGAYPLAGPGWGATCDTIALSDGDYVDVALYTDWGFYTDANAGFHYFSDGANVVHELATSAGQAVELTYIRAHESADGTYEMQVDADQGVVYYADELYAADAASVQTAADGTFALTFAEVGTYYLWTYGAVGVSVEGVVSSPAYAKVVVSEAASQGDDPQGDDPPVAEDDEPTSMAKAAGVLVVKAKAATAAKALKAKAGKKTAIKAKKYVKIVKKSGTLAFKKANKADGKKIAVNKKTGKITVKKGLARGLYTVKVRITSKATSAYAAVSKIVKVKIRVR